MTYLQSANRFNLRTFFEKVLYVTPRGCWIWGGAQSKPGEYPVFALAGLATSASRVVYQWFVGDIPDGFDIDHLCVTSRCVNPAHLEAVSRAENNRRRSERRIDISDVGLYCKHGHLRSEHRFINGNTVTCRICLIESRQARRERFEARLQGERHMERARWFFAQAAQR